MNVACVCSKLVFEFYATLALLLTSRMAGFSAALDFAMDDR